jgi:hypothetical protein
VEATDNRVEVHIQKIRFREAGSPGKVDLLYERTCGRYREEDAATADTRYERDLPPVPVPPPPVPPLFAAASPHGTNGHAASVPFDESQDVNPDEEEQDMEEFTP